MALFEKYVFRQAANALLLILLSLSGVVWIALALRQLNVVTSQGQDAWVLLQMTTLALPNLMAVIAPFALLIAVIHTLNRLNGDSELIVLTAAGATIWTIARPLILLGVLVALFVSFVNHLAMPWSLRVLREYIVQVRTDLLTQVIQPGRFSSPEDNLTFHIRERALNGELLGLIMHDTRDPKQSQSYLAERATIVKQDKSAYLVMSNGHILRRPELDEPAQIIAFEKYAVDLDRFDQKTGNEVIDLKPRERYLSELLEGERASAANKRVRGQFRAEIHERFANPLYPIAFVLIALASVGQAQSTRQNRMERMVAGFLIAVCCRLGGLAINNIVAVSGAAVPLLYALPVIAGVVSIVIMARNARPRSGLGLTDRVIDLFAWRRGAAGRAAPAPTIAARG